MRWIREPRSLLLILAALIVALLVGWVVGGGLSKDELLEAQNIKRTWTAQAQTGTPVETGTPAPSGTPLPPSQTPGPSSTPAASPTATEPGVTPTDLPQPLGENLLVNPQFMDADGGASFAGWSQINGYWANFSASPKKGGLHDPIPCSASGSWYLQMDNDDGGLGAGGSLDTWPQPPPPSEDWAWQDVAAPFSHTTLYIHWEEAHHIEQGVITLSVYGRNPSEGFEAPWVPLFVQDGVSTPNGTGKCQIAPPAPLDAIVLLEVGYEEYRFEIYGKMIGPNDGVLWGDFALIAE